MKRLLEPDVEQYDYSEPIKVSGGYIQVHRDGFKYYFSDQNLEDVQPCDTSIYEHNNFTIKINDVVYEKIKFDAWNNDNI